MGAQGQRVGAVNHVPQDLHAFREEVLEIQNVAMRIEEPGTSRGRVARRMNGSGVVLVIIGYPPRNGSASGRSVPASRNGAHNLLQPSRVLTAYNIESYPPSMETTSILDRLRREALDARLFDQARDYALAYAAGVREQRVAPDAAALAGLGSLPTALPDEPMEGERISGNAPSLWLACYSGANRRPLLRVRERGEYFAGSRGGAVACRCLGPERGPVRHVTHRLGSGGILRGMARRPPGASLPAPRLVLSGEPPSRPSAGLPPAATSFCAAPVGIAGRGGLSEGRRSVSCSASRPTRASSSRSAFSGWGASEWKGRSLTIKAACSRNGCPGSMNGPFSFSRRGT